LPRFDAREATAKRTRSIAEQVRLEPHVLYGHASRISRGRKAVYLDLGRVEVIEQVRINGHDLGTLSKEPYRLDVTEATE
jgi:hypothetical protein